MYKSVPANLQPIAHMTTMIALMIEVKDIDPEKMMIVNGEKENVKEIETEKEIEEIDQIGIKKEIGIEIEKETETRTRTRTRTKTRTRTRTKTRTGTGTEIEKEIEIEIERKIGRENETEIVIEIEIVIGIVIVKAADGAERESENENENENVVGKDFGANVRKGRKEKQEEPDVQEGEVEVIVPDVAVTVRDIVRVLDR
ncbi:hypothetical protein RhiirA4_182898 [Rhizophagus irregularis]|uniref:Uncharacterized protein n=1 Tax=Rhizophagus irregularis TaxID=588596 RepID=A0A2I1GHJ8_9GLOM|nr:hypothetical protein RhiirA4_182898 [Rhizophagus irregularis]